MQKQEVQIFSARLEDELFVLHDELHNGTYRHGPYEHFFVHDPKRRFISKASVKDRVAHQAVVQALEPIFERRFIHDSYSSRKGKGIHAAVLRLTEFVRRASQNYHHPAWALQCDIRKFFDSVDHALLLKCLAAVCPENETQMRALLREIVESYATDPQGRNGLPLGNVTSQLFANAYLNGFDHFVKEALHMRWYIRFCDDFVIVHHDVKILDAALLQIARYLEKKNGLLLHPKKIKLRKLSHGIDFVGQVLRPYYRIVRTRTRRRLFRRMRLHATQFRRGVMTNEAFRQSLQSSLGVLYHGSNHGMREILRNEVWRILHQ